MTDELKPVRCGCGGEAEVRDYKTLSDETAFYVSCRVCDTTTRSFLTRDKAITAWNRAMGGTSAEPEPKWTPVNEALPEEDEEVLVTVRFGGTKDVKPSLYVETASQISGTWTSYTDEYKIAPRKHHVIAWMPLPEPWRGE